MRLADSFDAFLASQAQATLRRELAQVVAELFVIVEMHV